MMLISTQQELLSNPSKTPQMIQLSDTWYQYNSRTLSDNQYSAVPVYCLSAIPINTNLLYYINITSFLFSCSFFYENNAHLGARAGRFRSTWGSPAACWARTLRSPPVSQWAGRGPPAWAESSSLRREHNNTYTNTPNTHKGGDKRTVLLTYRLSFRCSSQPQLTVPWR